MVAATRAEARDLERYNDDSGTSPCQPPVSTAGEQRCRKIVSGPAPVPNRAKSVTQKQNTDDADKIRISSVSSAVWICCQLGAREHYAVPRALKRDGLLAGLIT